MTEVPNRQKKKFLRQPRIERGAHRWQRWILPLNHWRGMMNFTTETSKIATFRGLVGLFMVKWGYISNYVISCVEREVALPYEVTRSEIILRAPPLECCPDNEHGSPPSSSVSVCVLVVGLVCVRITLCVLMNIKLLP